MKRAMVAVIFLACMMMASVAMAGFIDQKGTLDINRVSGYYLSGFGGGEFNIYDTKNLPLSNAAYASVNKVNGGFESFCLERNEFVMPPFDDITYTVNSEAVAGGLGGAEKEGDPLSVGTAWLYSQFAQGQLTGYNYVPGDSRAADARTLQEAIWWLEDE